MQDKVRGKWIPIWGFPKWLEAWIKNENCENVSTSLLLLL